ncbi:hypothetical protein ACOSP7_003639 [Xanthoceras sorbifolium]
MRIAIGVVIRPCSSYCCNNFHYATTVTRCDTVATSVSTFVSTSSTSSSMCLKTRFASKNPKFSWSSLEYDSLAQSIKLGKNWMKYQGINDWDGLLDPLDCNLQTEILRYGQFVEAAYRSFDFNPSSPTFATCKYPKNSLLARSGIGKTGYRITKNLRATCGVQLPHWINGVPSWVSTRSSWIGYVAVCQDKKEITRLGRRDVVIAYRGTATCLEWLENLRATLTSLPDQMVDDQGGPNLIGPMVESGFLSLYTSSTDTCPSLQEMIREEIARVLEMYGDEPLSFTITGHSLGAALATLTAYNINSTFPNAPIVTVFSFGGPRVGNRSFRCLLEKSGTKILRIVNSDDLITKIPGFVIDNNDVASNWAVNVAELPTWLQTQWAYADVGKELRLSSKVSPYLNNINVATCHELSTYLHLVNSFVSSTCPFRATAKRALKIPVVKT